MPSTRVHLSRRELYELVWTQPIQRLAKEYGLSDVGLAKICHRLEVPTPPRGYWQKLAKGLPVEREPLPALTPDSVDLWRVETDEAPTEKALPAPLDVIPAIVVGNDLRSAHAVTSELGKLITGPRRPDDPVHAVRGRSQATIRVSPEMKRRALLALDALFHAAEARGHVVLLHRSRLRDYGAEQVDIHVVVRDQAVEVSLIERTSQTKHELTKEEADRKERYGFSLARNFDRYATGELTLLVRSGYNTGRRFTDGAKRRLEDQLSDALTAIEEQGRRQRAEHEAAKVAEERAAIRREQAEAEQRQRDHMSAVERDLRKMTKRWKRANDTRAFIAAYEATLRNVPRTERINAWLEWAHAFVDERDPLTSHRAIAKRMTPKADEADTEADARRSR